MNMYKTIDLCAGIGGIRRGFEMTGHFQNVLSAEIDKYACQTYEHLFGENPMNDITTKEFKETVKQIDYDILLAGFPCQSFSRAGLKEGLKDKENGGLFFHISEIIGLTRPKAFLLENVDNLLSIDNGKTIKAMLETLIFDLEYHVVGTEVKHGKVIYTNDSFLRNTRDFGLPQNRPRVYIMGFDKKYFGERISLIDNTLPFKSDEVIYKDLRDLLDEFVPPKYFLAEGYLQTLERHKARHSKKGNGFGYMIVNKRKGDYMYANAILATGGSGKERNLIMDEKNNHAGKIVPNKKTPINHKNIRNMTPNEWAKLQGFKGYAFVENGTDKFSFPDTISDTQRYKQLGNAVSIPVIKCMAEFMYKSIEKMVGIKYEFV